MKRYTNEMVEHKDGAFVRRSEALAIQDKLLEVIESAQSVIGEYLLPDGPTPSITLDRIIGIMDTTELYKLVRKIKEDNS